MPIEFISQFLTFVNSYYSNWPTGGKKLFFRGHADKDWELLPAVLRSNANGVSYDERGLILDYKQVSVSEMNYRNKIENILVEMQHLCMPTRMLDWSLSPLVALYFACQSHVDKKTGKATDGAIYVLNPWESFRRIVAKLDNHPEIMDILKESRMLLAQKWGFNEIREFIQRKYGYEITKDALRAPLPFVGRYMVDRVASQHGGFILWGDGDASAYGFKIYTQLKKFPEYDECLSEKFIIPVDMKEKLLVFLRQMGVDNFTIFPDKSGIKKEIEEVRSLFHYK